MRTSQLATLVVSLSLSSLTWCSVRGDDWPQFRHDQHRSGLSKDSVGNRLVPLWDWEESQQASPIRVLARNHEASRPLGAPAIWHGRLTTLSNESGHPFVICADARTGLRLWKQPLASFAVANPYSGPAVTRSGLVYIPDTTPMVETQIRTSSQGGPGGGIGRQGAGVTQQTPQQRMRWDKVALPAAHSTIRALRAMDGTEVASFVLPGPWPRRALNSLITRIWLLDWEPWNLLQTPGIQSHWRVAEDPTTLGPFLLNGDQASAQTLGDMLVQWAPNQGGRVFRICHFDGPVLDLNVPALFQGFPLVSVPNGLLTLDDRTKRWVGTFGNGPVLLTGVPTRLDTAIPSSGPAVLWHRTMYCTMGIPAANGEQCFLPVGGDGARRGLVSFEPTSGRLFWCYPPHPAFRDLPIPAAPPIPFVDLGKSYREKWEVPQLDGRLFGPDEMLLGKWLFTRLNGPTGPKALSINPGGGQSSAGVSNVVPDMKSAQGFSASPLAHDKSFGLVTDEKRVFAWCDDSIVCLAQQNGQMLWKRPQPKTSPLTDMIGAKDRLIVCQDRSYNPQRPPSIRCYRMDDGRLEWSTPVPFAGQLSTAYGMVFVQGDNRIFAYAPAERTYRMAIDSADRDAYRTDPIPSSGEAPPESAPPDMPDRPLAPITVPPDAEVARTDPKMLGDATLLRLPWGESLPEMVRSVEERRRLLPGFPLLLSLDWLTADRSARLNAATVGWSDAEIHQFADTCGHLAAAGKPEHFQIGDEVNVYLIRHPEQRERVKRLVRAARLAIKKASPNTRVLVSFNAELVMDVYGRTGYLPFGEVKLLPELDRAKPQEVADEVEEVGISTRPQSGYIQPGQVSMNYLTAIKKLLGNKPTLVTRLEFRWDDTDAAEITQSQFARKMFQALYWLDAPVVAYPDLVWTQQSRGRADVALRVGDKSRPALGYWQDTLSWAWVSALSARVPDPLLPFKPDPIPTE